MHNPSPALIILSRDVNQYQALWEASDLSNTSLVLATDKVAEVLESTFKDQATILLSEPDLAVQVVAHLPNLKWCQSTWAGNAPLLNHSKQDYILTGVKGIFSQLMSEYVLSYILSYVRQHQTFIELQSKQQWAPPRIRSISELTIGILGIGNIATGMLSMFAALNVNIIGLSRSAKPPLSHPQMPMFTPNQLVDFIGACDVVINLLPDTPATQAFIDRTTIEALIASQQTVTATTSDTSDLPKSRQFINAGRGSVVTDEVLLMALDNGVFTQAVLDVFTTEPLPAQHVFWHRDDIVITQHTAAISKPSDVMHVFMENMTRYTQGLSPLYVMDWHQGY
ncbi:MAG: NAD(P)-dependent oxidoreductase [Glaciecola sp.]